MLNTSFRFDEQGMSSFVVLLKNSQHSFAVTIQGTSESNGDTSAADVEAMMPVLMGMKRVLLLIHAFPASECLVDCRFEMPRI